MLRKMLLLAAIASGFVLSSCQEDITLDIAPYENKLAVFCVLRPETTPVLLLNRSKSYFNYADTSSDFYFINDALVIITDAGTNEKDTLKAWMGNYTIMAGGQEIKRYSYHYRGKNKTQTGHKYLLDIWHEGKHVSSETFVPEPVAINNVTFSLDSSNQYTPYYYYEYHFKIKFADQPAQENAYNAMYKVIYGNNTNPFYGNADFNYDYNSDGKELTNEIYFPIERNNSDSLVLEFQIDNNTTPTAEYIESVFGQIYNGSDDFFTEPTIIKHNIKDGLGIFGAANISKPFRVKVE